MKALITSIIAGIVCIASAQVSLIPVEEQPKAEQAAHSLLSGINSEINRRVELHRTLFRGFWKNPDATPEEIAAAMGAKARLFFAIAAENVAHIERLAKLVGKTLDDFLPAADRERPKDILINLDGTVTLVPKGQ